MRVEVSETLGKILLATGQAVEVVDSGTGVAAGWPRVIEVATPWGVSVKFNASAPLNARWYPGLATSIVGQGGVLDDPSNGAAIGQPIRSAAGFPLFYALAGGSFVGTPSVCVGDQTFNSDAEALDYLARSTASNAGATQAPFAWRSEQAAPDLTAWNNLQTDEEKGRYLNANTQVARFLVNSGTITHEQSAAYANAALGNR